MDKMKRLIETMKDLIEIDFNGYIKINFTQGSLGRVEKAEEFDDSENMFAEENNRTKKVDWKKARS